MTHRKHNAYMRIAVAGAQNWRCAYYGCIMEFDHAADSAYTTSLDHIVTRASGGSNGSDNLIAACRLCNTHRRQMDPIAFWLFATGRWSPDLGKRSLSGLMGYAIARHSRGDPIVKKK